MVGSGTKDSPFRIGSKAELLDFLSDGLTYDGQYVVQTTSIEMGFDAVPCKEVFKGEYDGRGNSITEITSVESLYEYSSASMVAFLYGTIKNLNFYGTVDGQGEYGYGTVASFLQLGGKITNCESHINVSGFDHIGGIVLEIPDNESDKPTAVVSECKNYGNLSTTYEYGTVGGIANDNDGIIENCVNYGTIKSPNRAGGICLSTSLLVGRGPIAVSRCVNYGNVFSKYSVGGIVSVGHDGAVYQCQNYGEIGLYFDVEGNHPNYSVGGIVGENDWGSEIIECTNYGYVYGMEDVGGIVGYTESDVISCSNEGMVEAVLPTYTAYRYAINHGGIAGRIVNGEVSLCRNLAEVKGGYSVGGLVGCLQTEAFQDEEEDQLVVSESYNYGAVSGRALGAFGEYVAGEYGAGGIVGTIRVEGEETYDCHWVIKNVLNFGEVTGSTGSAQIVYYLGFDPQGSGSTFTIMNYEKGNVRKGKIPPSLEAQLLGYGTSVRFNKVPTAGFCRVRDYVWENTVTKMYDEPWEFEVYDTSVPKILYVECCGINENGLWYWGRESLYWLASWQANLPFLWRTDRTSWESFQEQYRTDDPFDITPAKWASLQTAINNVRARRSLSAYTFTTTSSYFQSGEPFYNWMYVEAMEALEMDDVVPTEVGDIIYANHFNYLQELVWFEHAFYRTPEES